MLRNKWLSTRSLLLITTLAILCGSVLPLTLIHAESASVPGTSLSHADLTVYFLDVGQGDATLIKGDDFTILIDAGRHDRSDVVPHLTRIGIREIDLFILTHPHSDHIGQCDVVVRQLTVHEVWMSGDLHTSRTFERCIDAILESDAGYHEPRAGETHVLGPAVIEVVHPAEVNGDLNNGSIGIRLIFGDVVFLFTGDAEGPAEQSMIDRGHDLSSHVLHVGHHGSRTSSTLPFLEMVAPEVAVYSAGGGNTYGHPHKEVITRFAALGIPLYGTDTHGTIVITTDGKTFEINTQFDRPPSGTEGGSVLIGDGCAPGQININTASKDELTRIVHVGPAIAERIIQKRFFDRVEGLIAVSGIGEKRLEDIIAQGLACAA